MKKEKSSNESIVHRWTTMKGKWQCIRLLLSLLALSHREVSAVPNLLGSRDVEKLFVRSVSSNALLHKHGGCADHGESAVLELL